MSVAKLWRNAWNGTFGRPARRSSWLEGAPEDVVAVEGRADGRGENEAGILPAPPLLELLFYLTLAVVTQGLRRPGRQPHAASLVALGRGEGGAAFGGGERAPHLERALVQVDVAPLQAQQLALPQARMDGKEIEGS